MDKLIIVLILLLGIIAVAQLMRVLELSKEIREDKPHQIPEGDIKMNANLWLLFGLAFMVSTFYMIGKYGMGDLPVAASEHGAKTDWLLKINFYIIILVFAATHILLFLFANKYHYRKDRKALFFPHDNKLELLWTIVPACVLAVIIILGLKTWNEMTAESSKEAVRIELYSKQFEWFARYSGDDNTLGHSDFRLVHSNNPVGVQTNATIDSAIVRLQKTVDDIALQMANADAPKETAHIMTDAAYAKAKAKKERTQRHIKRLKDIKASMTPEIEKKAMDDKVIKLKEIHLIVNKDYELTFRSQDVIHSAYMPHFRLQMNTVPGMTTRFKFKPTITTDSMRTVVGNDKFDYILLCNKICGSAHYNMQMVVKVDTEEGYKKWYAEQKTFKQEIMPEAAPAEKTEEVAVADSSAAPADSVKITALK